MCENKKNFFSAEKLFFFFFMSENVFSMNKTNRTFVFPRVKPPTRKKLYFKENTFFFPAKKIFVQQKKLVMCETEIKPFFNSETKGEYVLDMWNKKTLFSGEKRIILFNVL